MPRAWERVETLNDTHNIEDFSCGRTTVDDWLHEKSRANSHSVTTHVCLDGQLVNAFFALKTIIVSVDGFSNRLRRGSNEEGYAAGILLCQMGVGVDHHGHGHGKALLRAAMQMAAEVHNRSPHQLLVIDAADESLVDWYAKAGFALVPGTRRLVMPMAAVVKALRPA
ncbi:hypothetical protein [Cryobacterium sp. Y62]|uniref:hypothetical protein n=1 Tax=Cryobacterium sp. Y62 TaxID=2048284 RepID=UPI000CE3D898|nr:hypothetical protein [Cryobacterium sp. Y62]